MKTRLGLIHMIMIALPFLFCPGAQKRIKKDQVRYLQRRRRLLTRPMVHSWRFCISSILAKKEPLTKIASFTEK